MSVINFSIPSAMEQRVERVVRQKGFASKAEFFRLAAQLYMEKLMEDSTEDERMQKLTSEIRKFVINNINGRTVSSTKKRL